jgi:hypothetical protein
MNIIENNHWKEQKIALRELLLWDENARFSDKYFSKSEEELIKYFVQKRTLKLRIWQK